jgi:hypothetical protein
MVFVQDGHRHAGPNSTISGSRRAGLSA